MLKREIDAPTRNRRNECLSGDDNIVCEDDDIPCLGAAWDDKIADLVGGIPLEIPPFRKVNHMINLIDPEK